MNIYATATLKSSPTLRVDPRPPYPLIWCPKHRGTYLLAAGLGGAP